MHQRPQLRESGEVAIEVRLGCCVQQLRRGVLDQRLLGPCRDDERNRTIGVSLAGGIQPFALARHVKNTHGRDGDDNEDSN